jgi:ABC-type Zn uptake system ZnuABC Zn-binding protein ZnuA
VGLEAWVPPLLNAAGNRAAIRGGEGEINLSENIKLLLVPAQGTTRAAGDIHSYGNPHYWLGPQNGLIMANTIARRLSEIDPDHAADYEANRAAFEQRLTQKMAEWKDELAPYAGKEFIAYHEEWPYFAELRSSPG